jgi:hypothetical protein
VSPSPHCRLPVHWTLDPSQCWYDWQTLIGGILAVGAAALSVYFLRKQISQTDLLHQAELARQHNAVRTVTPIALSSISDFCHVISDEICDEIEHRANNPLILDTDENARKRLSPQHIPDNVLPTMQALVATLAEKSKIKHVAELVGSLQILQSRYNDLDLQQAGSDINLYGLLIDCAKVKLLTDTMFNYGRFVDEGNFSLFNGQDSEKIWDEIHKKSQSLVFSRSVPDLFFSTLAEKIKSHKTHKISPWMEKFE